MLADILQATLCKPTSEVATLRRRERRWHGPVPETFTSVPNKPALEFNGGPTWAELILVRLLERSGWGAAWRVNWGRHRAFWRDVLEVVTVPAGPAALFARIEARAAMRGGAWDVFAWRGDTVLFIESKQRGNDRLRDNQLAWRQAALDVGVPADAFAVVEYEAPRL